jgi:hypothetical protein
VVLLLPRELPSRVLLPQVRLLVLPRVVTKQDASRQRERQWQRPSLKQSHLLMMVQIAELKHIKEQIEIRLSQAFGHPEEGRRTYVEGKYAICITSGWNYKLNKKEYELMKGQLNPEFNPVKEKISYYVSAPEYRKVEEFGSKKDIEWLSKLMPKEPAKIRVQIELSANSKR